MRSQSGNDSGAWALGRGFALSVGLSLARMISPPAASEAAETVPVLTNVQHVLALGRANATRLRRSCRMTAVVTYHDVWRGWFVIQDDAGAILVVATDTSPVRVPGELVEVTGVSESGNYAPFVNRAAVRVLGTAPLPQAKSATLGEISANRCFLELTEVSGVVRDVVYGPNRLVLKIANRHEHGTVSVWGARRGQMPTNWIDARIRARGVNWIGEGDVNARTLADIEILEPGISNIFGLPAFSAADLLEQTDSADGRRVKVCGIVQHQSPDGSAFLRDGNFAYRSAPLLLLLPLGPHGRRAPRPDPARLKAGDLAEVVGERTTNAFGLVLHDADSRVIGVGPVQPPVRAAARDLLTGRHEGVIEGVSPEWRLVKAPRKLLII